jgi:hypothetical protein
MSKLTHAFVIASLTAASLHLSAKPAAADGMSFCALLEAVRINIENSMAPSFAKETAIAAIYSGKRAAACID